MTTRRIGVLAAATIGILLVYLLGAYLWVSRIRSLPANSELLMEVRSHYVGHHEHLLVFVSEDDPSLTEAHMLAAGARPEWPRRFLWHANAYPFSAIHLAELFDSASPSAHAKIARGYGVALPDYYDGYGVSLQDDHEGSVILYAPQVRLFGFRL